MENASKALIIAGAILISILLISIGIIMINSTTSVTDQVGSQTDSMAIRTFNGQFTSYEGISKSGSQVKALVNAVNASNSSNSNAVGVIFDASVVDASGNTVTSVAKLQMQKKYIVELIYATRDGAIDPAEPAGTRIVNGETTAADVIGGSVLWIKVSM